jgi:hypothetical protein
MAKIDPDKAHIWSKIKVHPSNRGQIIRGVGKTGKRSTRHQISLPKEAKKSYKHGRHKCSIPRIKEIEATNNGEQYLWGHSKLPIGADVPLCTLNPTPQRTIKVKIALNRITDQSMLQVENLHTSKGSLDSAISTATSQISDIKHQSLISHGSASIKR